jgi:hypothetical protein
LGVILKYLGFCAGFLAFISLGGAINTEKIVMILPLVVIGGWCVIDRSIRMLALSEKGWLEIGLGLLLAIISISMWRPKLTPVSAYDFSPATDLSYQDTLTVFRQAAITLQVKYPSAQVFGGMPEKSTFLTPYLGYVTASIPVEDCNDLKFDPGLVQLIVIHPFDPSQLSCRNLMDKFRTDPVERFESNGKWLEVYKVIAALYR